MNELAPLLNLVAVVVGADLCFAGFRMYMFVIGLRTALVRVEALVSRGVAHGVPHASISTYSTLVVTW